MPEVKKRTIVIASVLKPVNDTRMFEKIGQSLAETKQFNVHIIGFPGSTGQVPFLTSHELPHFKRLSLKRLFIRWTIFRISVKLKPDLLIVTTHELLAIALLIKLRTKTKIVYDVQENYYRNIRHTPTFPAFLRPLIASYVRLKEMLFSGFIDHFFLAEKSYSHELTFPRSAYTILENKLKRPVDNPAAKRTAHERSRLLFSGTLAESTGVFIAIELAVKLYTLNKNISLTIIGHCAQKETLEKIRNTIEPYAFIQLIGGDELVPHEKILKNIQLADAGIIAYPFNPSTYNSIPTKLFEYLGYKLPILLINHPEWVKLCEPYQAAIVFEPEHINPKTLLNDLNNRSFYSTEPSDVFWESEQPKLIRQIHQMVGF